MKSGLAISLAVLALLSSIPTKTGAVGVGQACGGFMVPPKECNPGLFCQKKAGQCFIADIGGTCARVPRLCPHIILPVCGCDGKTYNNDCERQRAMVSKNHDGKCY